MSASVLYDAPGPVARRRARLQNVAGAVLLLGLAALVLVRLGQQGQLEAQRWQILGTSVVLQTILNGLLGTLYAAGVAMVLAFTLGVALGAGRSSSRAWVARAIRVWVEFFRGLPLLLLILFIYLGAPQLGVTIPTFWALVLGLTLYNSAVIAEIVRAGVLSLPRGQREAALAVGLRPGQAMRLVLLPQALRLMLPTLISQLVTLLKDTSLGFVIGYTELLRNGRTAVEFYGGSYSLPIYTAVAVVYIGINLALSYLARRLDARQGSRPGRAGPAGEPVAARPGQTAGTALGDDAA